jgi:hypothetical protein
MKGFVTVTIEISDGITKSINSLTFYDEPDSDAHLVDVLAQMLEKYPGVLEAVVENTEIIHQKDNDIKRAE